MSSSAHGPTSDGPPPARPGDTRRFLARVLAVGAVIAGVVFSVWARSCAEADRCARAGGGWDEEWKVCRQ